MGCFNITHTHKTLPYLSRDNLPVVTEFLIRRAKAQKAKTIRKEV